MPDVPTGTVTFLFTDIEGSTVLWEQHRDAMRAALVRHDALVEEIVVDHHGHIVRPRGEGDSRFAVFARATDAVAAAVVLQQALYAEPWPTPTPLRVRMALHTGEADLRASDYYGSAVNRAARLRAVAHGGQTLVSLTTEQLVREQLAAGVGLRDLGEHRLKDLSMPDRIYQLIIDGQPADFPPLKTVDARPNNLPVQLTSFVGREQEIAAVRARLLDPQVHLLTLTAAGGSGKTRLALQVAAELLDDFADGVFFVDLAPLTDPALVASTVATSLGLPEASGQGTLERLTAWLHDRQLLLVLDNFEQVLPAATVVAALLKAAPRLCVLVTSRAPLHVRGEREFPVPPLALPDPRHLPPPEQLRHYEAVALFIARAQDVRPDFQVTTANALAVAEICARLDGLPLAIELAAARVKVLPPATLLARLEHRLQVLTGGARDLDRRQQTLRGAIDWSYQLLTADEQTVFVRLGIFVGGCTLEAAEAVCNVVGDLDVLEAVVSLVDKSLLRQREAEDGEPRFSMLETIREYAREQLEARGEAAPVLPRHASYFLRLAEDAKPWLRGPQQRVWLDRLEMEHDNLRAALQWALDQRETELALRLGTAVAPFWEHRGHMTEGGRWLDAVLSLSADATGSVPALRAAALLARAVVGAYHRDQVQVAASLEASRALYQELDDSAGITAVLGWQAYYVWRGGDVQQANALYNEQLALAQVTGNRRGIAEALHGLGTLTYNHGDFARAFALLEECLALYQVLGDQVAIAYVHFELGVAAYYGGDFAWATASLERSLALCQELEARALLPQVLLHLAGAAGYVGEYERAGQLLEEAQALSRELGKPVNALVFRFQGQVACQQGDWARARPLYRASLRLWREAGTKWEIAACLEGLGRVAEGQGDGVRAARVWGAAAILREQMGSPLLPVDHPWYEAAVARTRALLGESAFAAAWAEGQTMTLVQAISYALEEGPNA